ncbi:hypothetical protein F3B77_12035 [Bacteroides ovatus]|uniref:Uncharacterized protein n=1 Tax=Bacteroides ovatus TaxID=28116 RepID=A0A5M5M5P1_BACOV|nr:hypothetical protein [Bacteroides ovatus]KAA2652114.1 hypothetical protein F2S03_15325 [Alistipes onderdonkii]KAA4070674.1 hypothetical protein F3D37_09380 [Bacteroides ovatus]KAA4078712.1 hypothetical protein F3D38_10415 [Bacteroides ovatus]KAA4097589.1 hypothetical protein F3D40_12360 [Bacteroides ovatus]KAA4112578.1 hypothetical protein F3D35_13295 [Bacteroides ovatus]
MKNLLYIILLMLAICLTSCRSIKHVPVDTVKTEYKTRDSIRFDSIYEHDSIFLLVKGDTVYKEKYRYKYQYLTINKTDTVMLTDSVYISYPVEKQLTRWQQMKIELGGWAVGVIVILSIVLMLKLFRN